MRKNFLLLDNVHVKAVSPLLEVSLHNSIVTVVLEVVKQVEHAIVKSPVVSVTVIGLVAINELMLLLDSHIASPVPVLAHWLENVQSSVVSVIVMPVPAIKVSTLTFPP